MMLLVTKISSYRRFKKYTSQSGLFTHFLSLLDSEPVVDNVTNTVTFSVSDSQSLNACSYSFSVYNVVHYVVVI